MSIIGFRYLFAWLAMGFAAGKLKEKDVMYWDNWPIAHPFLLFGALDFQREDLLNAWLKLPLDYSELEVRRNSPMRHPLIWIL